MACIKQSALKHSYYKISKSKQRRPVRQGGWTLILVLNIVTYTSSKTHQVILEKTVNYYVSLSFLILIKMLARAWMLSQQKRGKFESMFISGLNKHCAFEKTVFRSLAQFATLAVFILEAYSYTFVPFHNQPLREKQTHKIVLLEKKY